MTLAKRVYEHRYLYMLLLPGFLFFVLFAYVPMYGILLAFKQFDYSLGIFGSPWTGLSNFEALLHYPDFWRAIRNTVIISVCRLLYEFPAPILLALLINEVFYSRLRKLFQTVFTFPHFLSWVVLSGILFNLFNDSGVVNQALLFFGLEKTNLLTDADSFRPLLYITSIWKEIGWGSIIYLAAIAGINPELYEAAKVDGASRFRQITSITWPGIRGTAAILFILAVGNVMNGGFDQVFNLYNAAVLETGDILDTYLYRFTFVSGDGYGLSTAIGLFKSVINFVLLFAANFAVRRLGEEGIV